MEKLYKGRGRKEDYESMMQALDSAFDFDKSENENSFLKMLPKLYKEKHNPTGNNFIVKNGERVEAAVGLYYHNVTVGDEEILFAGIGNVGVIEEARGKGYMQECMQMALDDMLEKRPVICELGGQRQRYGYFSFEIGAQQLYFSINVACLKHLYGKDAKTDVEIKRLEEDNIEILEKINALTQKSIFHYDRKIEDLYDTLISWNNLVHYIEKDGEFLGYAVSNEDMNCIVEMRLVDYSYIRDFLVAFFGMCKQYTVRFKCPPFEQELADTLDGICDEKSVSENGKYTVLDYETAIRVFLKAKSKICVLADGKKVVKINGVAGVENIKIEVENNEVNVCATDEECDICFEHKDAVRIMFGMSNKLSRCPVEFASWFPLPLYTEDPDNV